MIYEWNNNIVICISKLIDIKDNFVSYFIYVMNIWKEIYEEIYIR